MADSQTATATTRPRTTPVALGEFDGEFPEQERDGYWKNQIKTVLLPNPGKGFHYRDVSPTVASTLRKEHGINAVTQTREETNEAGETVKVLHLFVKWEPEKAEKIKQDVLDRGAKRKATMEANKAKNAEKSTGRQTAGNRS